MIRLITFRNFPLIDLQIEQAYRRRCKGEAVDRAFVETIDDELLWLVREASRQRCEHRDWLSDLAQQIDTLSAKSRKRRPAGQRRLVPVTTSSSPAVARTPQRRRRAG